MRHYLLESTEKLDDLTVFDTTICNIADHQIFI